LSNLCSNRADPDTGERARFSSASLPAWCRKTGEDQRGLPLLYLHGLSSGDFVPALGQFLGSSAGLSASVITQADRDVESRAALLLAAGSVARGLRLRVGRWIHVNIRLEEHKLCLLVVIGVRADGRKELVALADGYRESVESWADLLRDCARRGMLAPMLAVGDGALGFWSGLREVFPTTREQRCWFHKIANVLGALPKSAHPGAKKALAEIWNVEEPSPPCGTARRSPADPVHERPGWRWRSSSSRPRRTRWRAVNAPHLVALVRAGALFEAGKLVERPDEHLQPEAA
jgi:hypothetical protein